MRQHGVSQLGQLLSDACHDLLVSFGGGPDAECLQQCGGRFAGVLTAEHGMQALRRKVMEHEIDHGPRIEGLVHRVIE
jgi:hypothetical protein